jgi:hypothetical protein
MRFRPVILLLLTAFGASFSLCALAQKGPDQDAATAEQSLSDQIDYPSIDALEEEILGRKYVQDDLVTRVSRMEKKAFGSPSTNNDLSARTDALESYSVKSLHRKSLEEQQGGAVSSQCDVLSSPNSSTISSVKTGESEIPKMLSEIGHSLVGMTLGCLPVQYIQRNAQPTANASADNKVDCQKQPDPLVYLPIPPESNARLTVKVGWCEVQLLGRTYPELHLEQRLEQLSRILNFRPGTTAVALMDDMQPLIQSVQTRTSKKTIGASPLQSTH